MVSTSKVRVFGRYKALPMGLRLRLLRTAAAAAKAVAALPANCRADDVDLAAVDAIRKGLIDARESLTVISSEGAKDDAPRLAAGEGLGNQSGPRWDLAIDPVDGTKAMAGKRTSGRAVVAIAVGRPGALMPVPECFFSHILVARRRAALIGEKCEIDAALSRILSDRMGSASILARDRNRPFHERLHSAGWRVTEEETSELAAALDVVSGQHDLLVGIGGGPETLLMAVAARAKGARLLATPHPVGRRQASWLKRSAIEPGRIYSERDLVKTSTVLFVKEIFR